MTEEFKNNQGYEMDGNPSPAEEPVQQPTEATAADEPKPSATTYSWVNPKISGRPEQTNNSAGYTGQSQSDGYQGTYRKTYTAAGNYGQNANQNGYGQNVNPTGYGQNANPTGQSNGYYQYQTSRKSEEAPAAAASETAGKSSKKSRKTKKPMSTARRWGLTLAMAAVFGLVGGSVFTATAYVGQKMIGTPKQEIEIPTTLPQTPVLSETTESTSETPVRPGGEMTVREVSENCMPSLVAISTITVQEVRTFFGTQSQETPASGTGVIVGKNDTELLIATNNHVVSGAKSLSVVFADDQAVEGQIKGTDSNNDLAVVAVKLDDIPAESLAQIKIAVMGSSDDLAVGEQVVAIGNALGIGQSVTSGYVSALNRDISNTDEVTGEKSTSQGLIQTDAAINPGNSGGALLNMRGELVGINEAKYSSTAVEGMGFAIPISKAEPILQNLMSLETRYKVSDEQASYIGITMADVSASASKAYGIPQGVCIMSVEEGSPAEAAGLKKGDVLTTFDGRQVLSSQGLKDILAYYPAGETVVLLVQRANEGEYVETELTVTLGSAADMPKSQETENSGQRSNGFFGNP